MVPDDIRRQVEDADRAASDRRRAAITAHQRALEQHSQAATAATAAEVQRTRAAAHAAHEAYTRDGRHVTGRHDAAMLRWAADIAAQRDQRSQHAGQPAPAAEDTARVQANRAAVAANEAYKAGDLDRAEELTEQAAALDPSRAGLWQQHRNDIAARRLITAARAAHADGDHERAGQLLQDARQLDPRLRTLWDGGLPAQPATQPGRPGPGPGSTAPETHGTGGTGRPAATAQPGERAPQPAWPSPPLRRDPDRAAPAARAARRDAASSAASCSRRQVRANHGQRHRPARRTLTRMRAMTPPAGRHPAPAARRRQRPGPRRLTAKPGPTRRRRRKATVTRARPEQAPGHRRTGGTRFSARPASRGSPARAGRDHPAIHRTPEAAAPEPGIEPGR